MPPIDELPLIQNPRKAKRETKEFKNYEALCRGEDLMVSMLYMYTHSVKVSPVIAAPLHPMSAVLKIKA